MNFMMSRNPFGPQPCPQPNHTLQSPVVSRGLPHKRELDDRAAIAPILQRHAPDYEAVPYWSLDPVQTDESLPGQRYRLTLVHGSLRRAVPVQLHPSEADALLEAVRAINADWRLDLDRDGQIVHQGARAALRILLESVLGGSK